jgi:hypothetical protein
MTEQWRVAPTEGPGSRSRDRGSGVAGRRPSLIRLVPNERDARSVEFGLDCFSGHSATRETWATLGTHANEKRPPTPEDVGRRLRDGFDEGKVRTVSENAKTLKFDQSGFEES